MKYFLPVIPPLLACFCYFWLREKKPVPTIIRVGYFTLLGLAFLVFFVKVAMTITNPPQYDFTAFFIWGKAGAQGLDFYLPQSLQSVFNSTALPATDYTVFKEEIVNVGFLYPPPTMLYFAPLGFLSYKSAVICWMIINVAFATGCIYLIHDQFFKKDKLVGFIFVCILFVFLKPVLDTVSFLQTNFMVLFYLLLIHKYRESRIAGIFIVLGMFTKPFMAIFMLPFILRRKWGTVIYAALTGIVIAAITVLFFGIAPFKSYIVNSPAQRIPAWVYYEGINQSLHAVMIRLQLIPAGKSVLFLATAATIAVAAIGYIVLLIKKKLYDYVLPLVLLTGLLLYPGTLSYYAVSLLFIVFQFFDNGNRLRFNQQAAIVLVVVFYLLGIFSTFLNITLLFAVVIVSSVMAMRKVNPGDTQQNVIRMMRQ
ncbi:MAG: glycosyltransferase family 87 protein [Chitinophagaceae bacterium]